MKIGKKVDVKPSKPVRKFAAFMTAAVGAWAAWWLFDQSIRDEQARISKKAEEIKADG